MSQGVGAPRRVLELTKNDPRYVIIGWITGMACMRSPDCPLPQM